MEMEIEPERPQTFENQPEQAHDRRDRHRDRDRFIASIRDEDVCHLAASHHNGDPCIFFQPPIRGSYNICYFVQFSPLTGDGDQWVVRVPLAPCLGVSSWNKLESEVATMQLIAENTTIPIPKIHAYALGDGPKPFPSFIILEYVEGQKLTYANLAKLSEEQCACFYTSLADIHIQLRRLEFPSIGCVTRGPNGFQVRKKFCTIDLNMQELEGLDPSKIQDSYYAADGTLASANKYTEMLLQIADNAFSKGQNITSQEDGEDRLYHLHIFRQHAEKWVDQSLDSGPFVLVHGDLEIFNLLLDNNMHIVSVLDWEWSRVVPIQFFKPPLWLSNTKAHHLFYSYTYKDYIQHFDQFLGILRVRELERYGNELLADEWEKGKQKSGFVVAHAFESWAAMDWFANRYINIKVYGGKDDLPQRIIDFVRDNPDQKALIERKVLEWTSYNAQLDQPSGNLEHDNVLTTAQVGKWQSIFVPRSFLMWLHGIPTALPNQVSPITAGTLVLLIAGASYLSWRHTLRFISSR